MYQRQILQELGLYLQEFPAVDILGPRQVGKTTLAHQLFESHTQPQPAPDLAQLSDPNAYFAAHADRLVILDEVQRIHASRWLAASNTSPCANC
jgi:predicted AAA+ superfamily ATPase